MAIRQKALPEGHSDIAASLNNLAALYYIQQRYGEALPLFERALEIVRNALGDAHPHTQTVLEWVEACRKQGR